MENKNILVIEDNELNRELVRALLQRDAYNILEAEDAETGIRLAREQRPVLILFLRVQSLLDINKMEEGKLVPQRETIHLPELIEGILEQFNPIAEERQISLSFSCLKEIPSLSIDRSLMERVFANLLNNEVRHTPGGAP